MKSKKEVWDGWYDQEKIGKIINAKRKSKENNIENYPYQQVTYSAASEKRLNIERLLSTKDNPSPEIYMSVAPTGGYINNENGEMNNINQADLNTNLFKISLQDQVEYFLKNNIQKHPGEPQAFIFQAHIGGNHWATYACNTAGEIMVVNSMRGYESWDGAAIEAFQGAFKKCNIKQHQDPIRITGENPEFAQKNGSDCGPITAAISCDIFGKESFHSQEEYLKKKMKSYCLPEGKKNNINYELRRTQRASAEEIDNPPPELRQTNQQKQQITKQKLIEQKNQDAYSTINKQLTNQIELQEIKRPQKSKMASNLSGVQDIKTTITMDRQLSPAWLKQCPVEEQRYYSSLDEKGLRAHLDNLFETDETRYRNETIHQSTIHIEYFKNKIKKSDEFKIDAPIITKFEENNTVMLGGMGGIYKIDLTSPKPSPEPVVQDPNMFVNSIGSGNINEQKCYITSEANSNKVRIWDKDMKNCNQIEIPYCDKVITSVMGYKDKFVCVDRQGTVSVISSDGQVHQIPGLKGKKPGSQGPRLSQLSIKEGKLVRQDKEGTTAPETIEDKIDKYFTELEAKHITPFKIHPSPY